MNFKDAVMTCLKEKYASFEGRARRSEFWYFMLFILITNIGAAIVFAILGALIKGAVGAAVGYVVGASLVSLGLICPLIAVSVRRLHDTGKSGWMYLLNLIPYIGSLILLVFYCFDSKEDNQYGPNPKGAYKE